MTDILLPLILPFMLAIAMPCADDCAVGKTYHTLSDVEVWQMQTANLSERAIWAHIVAGEAGGLADGALLVAWTLRAWEVERGMPAELAGPRWGWYGWKEPVGMHYAAVDAVMGQPLAASPYAWMRAGHYCELLGSDADLRYWRGLGWDVQARVRLEWPEWGMSMNCVWQ